MSYISLNDGLHTIRQLATDIVDACSGLIGGSSAVCMKSASEILTLVDSLLPTMEEEVPFGTSNLGEMEGRLEDGDRVSRSREDVRSVCHKTKSERDEFQLGARQLSQAQTASARARSQIRKARRSRRRAVKR